MVPKEFAMSDIYCQLIPNDDEKNPYYEVVPRIGSFEVSFNGVVSIKFFGGYNFIFVLQLLFSKCLSGMWPNYPAVSERCFQTVEAAQQGQDISMFQTSGLGQQRQSKKGKAMGATGMSGAPEQQESPVA